MLYIKQLNKLMKAMRQISFYGQKLVEAKELPHRDFRLLSTQPLCCTSICLGGGHDRYANNCHSLFIFIRIMFVILF